MEEVSVTRDWALMFQGCLLFPVSSVCFSQYTISQVLLQHYACQPAAMIPTVIIMATL